VISDKYFNQICLEKNLRNAGKIRKLPQIFSSEDSWRAVEDDHIPFMERGQLFRLKSSDHNFRCANYASYSHTISGRLAHGTG
jgi:hypothetical protein